MFPTPYYKQLINNHLTPVIVLFTEINYFIFLFFCTVAYSSLPKKYRGWLLLVASYAFYAAFDWRFTFLLLTQTLICFFCAKYRKNTLAIILSILELAVFKYFNFFNDSFRLLFDSLHLPYLIPHLNVLLPVGISFFTFQSLGYVIDVSRGKVQQENDLPHFALFVAFFPQLAAGPIGRADELLPQFNEARLSTVQQISEGIQLIIWGLFQKMVVADRLTSYITRAYASPKTATGGTLIVASIFFSIQIYADFSGYSDIARGSAKFFGIDLRNNFNFPYFATSIPDFWKRWHISLTSWFRDYLYIPLGGNRVSKPKWIRNQIVVFLLSGLWHGANWTFIFWGAIHGIFNLAHAMIFGKKNQSKSRIINIIRCTITFVIVNTAWIFFRAPTFKRAIQIIIRIMTHPARPSFGVSQNTFALNVFAIMILFGVDFAAYRGFTGERCPDVVRIPGYAFIACLIALLAVSSNSFIYLQF